MISSCTQAGKEVTEGLDGLVCVFCVYVFGESPLMPFDPGEVIWKRELDLWGL